MHPWDLWLSSFTVNQLRPYGQIPETESFSRRNSLEAHNTVSLRRMLIDVPITNMDVKAQTEVVQMLFDPPVEIGGQVIPITIPAWWWGTAKLTADDVRASLRGEAEARLQGRPLEGTFMRNYIVELRTELDHCARTLPATLFAPPMDDDPEYADATPLSVTHNEWEVKRDIISDVTVRMTFQRRDVTLDVSLPLTVLHQSPGAAQDWVLLQVSL